MKAFVLVLDLGLLVLACNYQTCRYVSKSYGGICSVYALAAVSGGSVYVHPYIVWIQVNFNVVDFRKDCDSSCRSVDSSAGLCFRYTLYSVSAALVFEP